VCQEEALILLMKEYISRDRSSWVATPLSQALPLWTEGTGT